MVLYSYTRDIPDGPHNPSTDQPDMEINNNHIDDLLAEDHYSFNVSNGGFHKQVRMPSLNAIPIGLIANSATLYVKGTSPDEQLYFTRGASGVEVQITGPNVPNAVYSVGRSFLPGGILMQWGTTAIPAGDSATGAVSFAGGGGINFPNLCFQVFVTLQSRVGGPSSTPSTLSVRTNSASTTGFTYDYKGASSSYPFFSWLAIGN